MCMVSTHQETYKVNWKCPKRSSTFCHWGL
jgi:hypothetical protein